MLTCSFMDMVKFIWSIMVMKGIAIVYVENMVNDVMGCSNFYIGCL